MYKGIPARKSLGQNFLSDKNVAGRIIDAAGITPDTTVVEVGPGHGALTFGLVERAGRVIAIELDPRLHERLGREFRGVPNIDLVLGDALEYDYESLPGKATVVGNLPYYISTPILSRLIRARAHISTMVLMLQKEVSERITAEPGGKDYGYLSVIVQLHTVAEALFKVSRECFSPVPKVDSSVVRLTVREGPAVPCRDYALFERVVSASFSLRRKTLKNALKASDLFTEEGMKRLSESGIDPIRRAETLSVREFAALADFLFEFRKSK